MARTMVFIDHMNFQIALGSLFSPETTPRLDYNELPRQIVASINAGELMKTILFIPKPDEFLMKDEGLEKYYLWAAGMKVQRNFDVVEGTHMARPTKPNVPMNIRDNETYYKVEKGTDVNMAIYSLRMAFFNAYDTAVFVSGDTDYLPIYDTLRVMGKLVMLAVVKGQYIGRLIPNVDGFINLDRPFFERCTLRDKITKRKVKRN
ncbi:MAG: NYN domain-containing protein [Synergistaceae bacterium]|nr:NYN domain-containing protein [Synergistaceae bacterium]